MDTILEPARDIPIVADCDICVVGGSCTGVFAAVRAARLGAKVALVEQQGMFGGTATVSFVNMWHSLYDTESKKQIINGLTAEVLDKLKEHNAVKEVNEGLNIGYIFNSSWLAMELDKLVVESNIKPFLHTSFVRPVSGNGKLSGVVVENKSGSGVIKAKMFIDATGDGDLCHRLNLESYSYEMLQPSSTCFLLSGSSKFTERELVVAMKEHGREFGLNDGFVFGNFVPGSNVFVLCGTRVKVGDCSDAEVFTASEIEGRRQARAVMELFDKYLKDYRITLQALPTRIGIRQTRHIRSLYQITSHDVLYGKRFDDAIANGSYRVDVHYKDKPGTVLKYLDGTQYVCLPGYQAEKGRWREETQTNPTFYQIPYRSLVPAGGYDNLLMAGRMIDAQEEAYGALRVMVNMNQMGEAAGVAAYVALSSGKCVDQISVSDITDKFCN